MTELHGFMCVGVPTGYQSGKGLMNFLIDLIVTDLFAMSPVTYGT